MDTQVSYNKKRYTLFHSLDGGICNPEQLPDTRLCDNIQLSKLEPAHVLKQPYISCSGIRPSVTQVYAWKYKQPCCENHPNNEDLAYHCSIEFWIDRDVVVRTVQWPNQHFCNRASNLFQLWFSNDVAILL